VGHLIFYKIFNNYIIYKNKPGRDEKRPVRQRAGNRRFARFRRFRKRNEGCRRPLHRLDL